MKRPNPKHILPVLQAEIEDGNWDMLETMCTSAFYADGEWLELEEIEDFDGANDLMNERPRSETAFRGDLFQRVRASTRRVDEQ